MTIPAEWQSSLRGAVVAQGPEAQVRARELSDHRPMIVETFNRFRGPDG